MDAADFISDKVCKRQHPLAERRARIFRRIVLLAFTVALANLVATMTGCALPSAHELWDRLVSLGQAIANIPAA
jgi:hypothetical protein